MRLLIDGDWIIYTAGFASQHTTYVCPELFGAQEFPNMTALDAAVDALPLSSYGAVYSRVEVDDISHTLHSAKQMLIKAIGTCQKHFNQTMKAEVYISKDGNFRHQIATIAPYKGNRPLNSKPAAYPALLAYLEQNWNALPVYGQEADDQLAIEQSKATGPTCIVGVDKDLLQVPGYHYNPNKGFTTISPALGELLLYRQALTGDPTDNIKGCYKAGAKAASILIQNNSSATTKWNAVVRAYEHSIDKYGSDLYNGLSGYDAALENMRLVYLRRRVGEIWTPGAGV